MRRTHAENVLQEAFSARLEALDALGAADARSGTAPRLYAAVEKLRPIIARYGQAPSTTFYGGFAELVHIVGLLCEWRETVMNAGTEAARFRAAAQARADAWLTEYGGDPRLAQLREVAACVHSIGSAGDVSGLAGKLAAIPLPIGIFAVPDRKTLRQRMGVADGEAEQEERLPDLSIAFVKFAIDGVPLAQVHGVAPGAIHDIDIEVRITRWPENAAQLVIEPVTVEPLGTYRLPTFRFRAPVGQAGPFRFTDQSRFVLSVPQHFGARPLEFVYAARFEPLESEQPVEIVGQRVLVLEGIDPARTKITGYPGIDQRLLEMRNAMRILPHMVQPELADALIFASVLGNYCGQVVQDNLYREAVSEREFQRRLRMFLRADPRIGAELEEHASASGGFTDLSFRGIRLELKVESEKRLGFSDCSAYTGQAASYTVGSGKHIGILCVLDCSPKSQPPFPMEDGVGVFTLRENAGAPVYVLTFLLQGNLPRPSDLSR